MCLDKASFYALILTRTNCLPKNFRLFAGLSFIKSRIIIIEEEGCGSYENIHESRNLERRLTWWAFSDKKKGFYQKTSTHKLIFIAVSAAEQKKKDFLLWKSSWKYRELFIEQPVWLHYIRAFFSNELFLWYDLKALKWGARKEVKTNTLM